MPRYLRAYMVACVAVALGYLLVHVGEPLRLNIGDPWSDASALTSIERVLGTRQLTVFRVLALVFSALGAWLLFQYARRMWNDTVAIVATALTTTSLVWMMFADSIQRPPIMHAACFLALWGVVRALETGLRRHHIAALAGTVVCLFAGSDDWLFLPLGVLFTIHVKRGNPFARGNWRVVAVCAAGGLLAGLLRSLVVADASTWQFALDQRVPATFVTLVRRYTVMLAPTLWVTLGWVIWRAVWARSVKSRIEDGTTWMLIAALVFAVLPWPQSTSAMLRTQQLLPLYAIGSALLISRLFEHGGWLRRALAVAWCVATPLWGLWLMLAHPREVLDRHDLARANEYFAHNDGNNFVMSNLLADGPLVTAFGRHGWTAPYHPDPSSAHLRMLEVFEATGTDYAHAVIFTTPGSRFVDRSISQVVRRHIPSIHGWPYLVRHKVNHLIEVYDAQVLRSLEAVGAKRVLQLSNFDIYRIDRSTTLETAARSLPVVPKIDFDRVEAVRHQLLGWGDAVEPTKPRATSSSIGGYGRCRNPLVARTKPAPNMCTVVETANGLDVSDVGGISRAEIVVRVERACDQQLTVTLATPSPVDIVFNGAIVLSCGAPLWGTSTASVRVPQHHVHAGLNIISLDDRQPEPKKVRPEITSVVIEPTCEPLPERPVD